MLGLKDASQVTQKAVLLLPIKTDLSFSAATNVIIDMIRVDSMAAICFCECIYVNTDAGPPPTTSLLCWPTTDRPPGLNFSPH